MGKISVGKLKKSYQGKNKKTDLNRYIYNSIVKNIYLNVTSIHKTNINLIHTFLMGCRLTLNI